MDTNTNTTGNITTFLSLAAIAATGIILSSMIIGALIYEPMVDKAEEDEKEDELHYRMKYFDELEELEDRKMTKEELKDLINKVIHESTPDGDVIMTYNSDTETFWYYADSKSMQYWALDTVARLYTVNNNCKCVCVNYMEEFYKGKEKTINNKENDERSDEEKKEEEENAKKSVFVKYKNYNKGVGSTESKNDVGTKKYRVMTEISNRFTYKGKLSEYEDKQCLSDSPSENEPKKIDFATFKNRFTGSEKIKNS